MSPLTQIIIVCARASQSRARAQYRPSHKGYAIAIVSADEMATVEIPRCRACGIPVPSSSSGRRLLEGPSNSLEVSVWKNLLQEKLEELKLSVNYDELTTGFMCRRCFDSMKSFHGTKEKLLGRIHEAVKYMNTSPKPDDDDNVAAQSVSLLGKRQADPNVDVGLVRPKRPHIQYNLPSTTTSSPDVQVKLHKLTINF